METLGYLGFGLSPHGKMEDSDVIIFLVDSDGNAEFTVSSKIRLHDFPDVVGEGGGSSKCGLFLKQKPTKLIFDPRGSFVPSFDHLITWSLCTRFCSE